MTPLPDSAKITVPQDSKNLKGHYYQKVRTPQADGLVILPNDNCETIGYQGQVADLSNDKTLSSDKALAG